MKIFKHQLLSRSLLLFALFAACNNSQQTKVVTNGDSIKIAPTKENRNSVLIPGISAGAIKINQDASEAFNSLGQPDSSDAAMQKTVAFWYKGHDRKSTVFAIYTARDTGDQPLARIKQIRLTSPEYKTEEGLRVSSALSTLKNKFELRKVNSAYPHDIKSEIYDSDKGIAFEIGSEGNCTAVIIHPAKEPLKGTYLPLR